MSKLLWSALGVIIVLALGCGSTESASEEEVLISLTDDIVVPGYQAVAAEAALLEAALEELCARPSDAALSEARQAWRDIRAPWMRSEATWFGPVMERRSLRLVDWSTTEPERIEGMLEGRASVTEDEVRNVLSSTQRGLGAIEYLIFGSDALERLSGSDSPRCDYLTALGSVVRAETEAVLDEWTTGAEGEPAYSDFFTGRSSSSLLTGQAVAEAVRTQVFLIRAIVDIRLASALGLRGGGPDPSALLGGDGHNALEDMRNEVLGMRDVYLGPEEGMGISALVATLSSDADERMRSHFEASTSAIDAVEGPLKAAVLERPEQVRAVYDALSALQTTLNTEVVSLLGVSVGFSDTDGDSMR